MRLNLKSIEQMPGAIMPFSFSLNLSEEEFFGSFPVAEPVIATGEVRNRAGALVLTAAAVSNLHVTCDRCMRHYIRALHVPFTTMLATELQEEEQDDIILLEDGMLDVGELIQTVFILNMPGKNLCAEDCKGLCSGCGADLNVDKCRCSREGDPRLAGLADYFKGKGGGDTPEP